MNDLIILAFAVLLLLAVVPMFLMNRAFKGASKRVKNADESQGKGAGTGEGQG